MSRTTNPLTILILASCIYKLTNDESYILLAIEVIQKISDKYQLIDALYYLKDFNSSITDKTIQQFIDSNDYLISYNAKRLLNIL